MTVIANRRRYRDRWRLLVVPVIAMISLMFLGGCGASNEADGPNPDDIEITVTSGSYTTTIRANEVTELPFAETILVEVMFEDPVYGSAGQTSVFATADPTLYRIEPRSNPDSSTFAFALTNRLPGTVEVSIFANRDSSPLNFSLQIGDP